MKKILISLGVVGLVLGGVAICIGSAIYLPSDLAPGGFLIGITCAAAGMVIGEIVVQGD